MSSSAVHAGSWFFAAFASVAPQARIATLNDMLAKCSSDSAAMPHAALDEIIVQVVMYLAEEEASKGGSLNAALVMAASDDGEVRCVGMSGAHEQALPLVHHAALCAIQDATQQLGYSDLSGHTLYTFAPCCPVCDAIVLGCGIEAQRCAMPVDSASHCTTNSASATDLCSQSAEQIMTHIAEDSRDELLEKLQGHGAVLLDAGGRMLALGDAHTHNNPLAMASAEAVMSALELCQKQWLPEGCTLVSYHKPHIFGVLLAHQARLLRACSLSNNLLPDAMRICYLNDAPEEMVLRDAQGQDIIARSAEDIRQQLMLRAQKRDVPLTCAASDELQPHIRDIYTRWQSQSGAGARFGQ